MKKRALGLSGEAAMLMGNGEAVESRGRGQTKENHAWFVIRGIPLAILEPLPLARATSPSSSSSSLHARPAPLSVPSGPETSCFFTGLWDFFHADRRVVHQKGLTVSLFPSLFRQRARTFVHTGEEEMREKEGKSTGKEGRTIKKRKCQPP